MRADINYDTAITQTTSCLMKNEDGWMYIDIEN